MMHSIRFNLLVVLTEHLSDREDNLRLCRIS